MLARIELILVASIAWLREAHGTMWFPVKIGRVYVSIEPIRV